MYLSLNCCKSDHENNIYQWLSVTLQHRVPHKKMRAALMKQWKPTTYYCCSVDDNGAKETRKTREKKKKNLPEPVLLPDTCANVTVYLPCCSQYLPIKLVALCTSLCTQVFHGKCYLAWCCSTIYKDFTILLAILQCSSYQVKLILFPFSWKSVIPERTAQGSSDTLRGLLETALVWQIGH